VHRNLIALQSSSNRARAQIQDYEHRLAASPTVERDYVQIQREREIAQNQFTEIQNKLQEAGIARTFESEARGERFTLIRAPYAASSPASPNRLGIVLLGIVLGAGLAIGLAAVKEGADPTVRGPADIMELTNLPLIGAIPDLLNQRDRYRRKRTWATVAGVYGVAAVVVVITVIGSIRG
jgi:protein tyrosine kinase modulator